MTGTEIILKNIRTGKEPGFEALFKQYYPRLSGYAVRFVESDEIADDIVQDVFLRFYEHRMEIKDISLSSLLFAMVRNSCIDYLRHKSLIRLETIDYLAHLEGEERLYNADFAMTPEDTLLYDELRSGIKNVIDGLPPKCREVFLMSRFEGLKNREIAERNKISVKSVEKHLGKALSAFSRYFKEKYPTDVYIAVIAWLTVLFSE